MTLSHEHKALLFLGAVAVLGATVRVVRAANGGGAPATQPALDHQRAAADSAAQATKAHAARRGQVSGGVGVGDTTRRRARRTSRRDSTTMRRDSTRHAPPGLLDRRGYIGNRLDLDVATAAQIDSLPGVTPSMARRIVADRMARGPFLNTDGLRRVAGAGPAFLRMIDTLVTFSGTLMPADSRDTVVGRRRRP